MKKQILAAVILSSLSAATFALPQTEPQPLLGEIKATRLEALKGLNPLAKNGAERLLERFAEGGAERLQERFAEGGAARTLNQRIG